MQFKIEGMSCANCVNKIETALKNNNIEGNVSLATNTLTTNISVDQIGEVIKIVSDLNFKITLLSRDKIVLKIEGMSCVNCQNKVLKAVAPLTSEAEVSAASGYGHFILKENVSEHDLIATINDLGYTVVENNEDQISKFNFNTVKLIIGLIATVYFILKMILIHFLKFDILIFSSDIVDFIIATIVQFTLGLKYYKEAYSSIKVKSFGMDFLVASSTTIAYVYSIYLLFFTETHLLFFEIQVILLSVIYLGNYIEDKIKQKSRKNLDTLMNLHIKKCNVLVDDYVIEKDIEFVKVDDVIIVNPGSQIPLDGVIIKGNSTVDESLLTGEERPISKKVKDEVYGGTINQTTTLHIKVLKKQSDTYLAKIIEQVNTVASSKPTIQKVGDKIVKIFVPTIFVISFATFVIWLIITNDLNSAMYSGLATLIIACPCALGLATPLSFMIGNSKLYQNQLLVKDPSTLMEINQIKTIAFDKTGTITTKVVSEIVGDNITNELLSDVLSLEKQSKHPIANAIVTYLQNEGISSYETSYENIVGLGLKNDKLAIGSLKLVKQYGIDTTNLSNEDVFVIKDKEIVLTFKLEMKLLENNIKTLNELSKHYKLVMITGDNEVEAQKVEKLISFDKVYANSTPEQKKDIISELQKTNKVLFVGDGINDTIALTMADLSIAINNEVDAVKEVSDVVLLENDLQKISKLIYISKRIRNNVYQNYFWAFSYNVIAIPLAVTGNLNPLIAGVMMSISSIFVVLNANRLLSIK